MRKRFFCLIIVMMIILSGCSSEKGSSSKNSGEKNNSKTYENELIGNVYSATAPVEANDEEGSEEMEITETYLSFYPGGILGIENESDSMDFPGAFYEVNGDKICIRTIYYLKICGGESNEM